MADEEPSWLNKRSGEALWEEVQTKTFKAWVNMHLKERKLRVSDLEKDLGDGVKLIALLEILSQTKIEGRYYRNPKSKPYKIDNVNFALTYIADVLHVSLISCSAEDVVDGNIKIILGMIWKLIQKFQLPSDVPRQYLLSWAKQATQDMAEVTIDSFHRSFKNGLAFCGIVQAYDPSLLDVSKLDGRERVANLTLAFELAEEAMGVPALLDPNDIAQGLADERSIMTYLSMINRKFEGRQGTASASSPVDDEVEENVRPSQMRQVVNAAQPKDSRIQALEEQNQLLMKQIGLLQQQNKETMARLEASAAEAKAKEAKAKEAKAKEAKAKEVQAKEDEAKEVQAKEDEAKEVQAKEDEAKEAEAKEAEEQKELDEEAGTREPTEESEDSEDEKDEDVEEDAEDDKKDEDEKQADDGDRAIADVADANEPETEKQAKEAEVGEREAPDALQELEDTRRSLRQQIQVGETLQKSLEDAREELGMVQKKHKRATEKALKKQQKRHEKRLQRRDKELEAVKQNATAELQQKNDEIKRLKLQLKKAQAALGERAVDQETTEADEDIVLLKAEYENILSLVAAFEEEEQQQMKKAARPRADDADDDDGMEE